MLALERVNAGRRSCARSLLGGGRGRRQGAMQGKQSMAATSGDEWMDEGDGSGAKEVEEGRGETGATAVRPGARREDTGEELGTAELATSEARGGEAEKAAGSWRSWALAWRRRAAECEAMVAGGTRRGAQPSMAAPGCLLLG